MPAFRLGIVLCVFFVRTAMAQDELTPGKRILAGQDPIDVGGFRGAAPCFGDFDGDGLDDLLVGHDQPGRLRIYRNVGTKKEPRFDGFEWFRVDGEIAELPVEGAFQPQLVDLDGDGLLDIVTATDPGITFWYKRVDRVRFADPEILKLAGGNVLNAGTNAWCHVVDWDGDGDNDLIVAGRPAAAGPRIELAAISLVENIGSPGKPSFAAPRPLEAGDGAIQARNQLMACPFVVDWNGDGTLDLLLGLQDGSVVLYENRGTRRVPRLEKGRELVASPLGQPPMDGVVMRQFGAAICITDWNGDGRPEIVMGDAQEGTAVPEDGPALAKQLETARQEAAEVLGDYRRMRLLNDRLAKESQAKGKEFMQRSREQQGKRLEELREKIAKLEKAQAPRQVPHGYVWLLERRPR